MARTGKLPTPLAMSGRQVGARTKTRQGRTLLEVADGMGFAPAEPMDSTTSGRSAIAVLLPSPQATDSKRGALTMSKRSRPREGRVPYGPSWLSEALSNPETRAKLPTPRASDATKGVRSMPEREGGEGPTLPEAINRLALLPTPTTRPNNHKSGHDAHGKSARGVTLTDAVMDLEIESTPSSPTLVSTGDGIARLSPRFVAWMMGLPPEWEQTIQPTPTSSTSLATASSRSKPRSRSSSSGIDSTAQLSLIQAEIPE